TDLALLARVRAAGPRGTPELLGRLAASPVLSVVSSYRPDADTPAGWLLRHGLLLSASWGMAVMPREVAIGLRGGRLVTGLPTSPPPLLGVPVDPDLLDPGAVARALGTTSELVRLLDLLSSEPAADLASGGVGVRELRRLAKTMGSDEFVVGRRLELAAAMGLLGIDPARGAWVPSTAYDQWVALPPGPRWLAALAGWQEAPRPVSGAGLLDPETGRPQPALAGAGHPYFAKMRRAVLDTLAAAGGSVPAEGLLRRLEYDRPMLFGSAADELADLARLLVEAEELGLVAAGALTGLGRAAARGDLAVAADRVATYGPPVSDRLVISGDLTALAAGQLPADVATELALLADVISRDIATTYRFTAGSLRRGLDAGRTSEQILAFLEQHAEHGLPQPLRYLVADLGRRHGQVRVGAAAAYVRCVDPAVAAELASSRGLAALGLRHLGGGVLVAAVSRDKLLAELQRAGHLPVAEDATGAIITTQPAPARVAARQVSGGSSSPLDDPGDELDLTDRPAEVASSLKQIRALLRLADDEDFMVRLAVPSGSRDTELSGEVAVEGSRVRLFLPDGRQRSVPIASVRWVRVLTEAEEEALYG
ncbi:MAG: helicase-associated domain-containing protein, partial [Mycobacteriales bacterium]